MAIFVYGRSMGVRARNKWYVVKIGGWSYNVRGPNIEGLGFRLTGRIGGPDVWRQLEKVVATMDGKDMPGLASSLLEDLHLYPEMGKRRASRAYPSIAFMYTELVPE